jgi:cell division protein FtsW
VAAYRLFDVVRLRVDIWLNPWPEADGRAFQIVQSLLAFAAGGVFGQGIGQGSPGYIPVVHSDFVFAALAEEWGLLGVIVVVACVAAFVVRGLRIAILQRPRPFHALLAVGLSVILAAQSLLIMAGVLKLIPLTGVTLPYFSYGGSSLLVNFIMVGLLLRLSAGEN